MYEKSFTHHEAMTVGIILLGLLLQFKVTITPEDDLVDVPIW